MKDKPIRWFPDMTDADELETIKDVLSTVAKKRELEFAVGAESFMAKKPWGEAKSIAYADIPRTVDAAIDSIEQFFLSVEHAKDA